LASVFQCFAAGAAAFAAAAVQEQGKENHVLHLSGAAFKESLPASHRQVLDYNT
jgi:hypothetical protein